MHKLDNLLKNVLVVLVTFIISSIIIGILSLISIVKIISLKKGGGLGGHNGLRSAKAVLGTADFWRLRFGIGRPQHDDVAGYVLSDFTADEKIIFQQIFPQAAELLEQIFSDNPDKLLSKWNKKNLLL